MKIIKSFLTTLLVFCVIFSCKKEEIDNSDNTPSLELTATQDGSTVKLNWTETIVSTFQNYRIARSVEPLPEDFAELPLNAIITSIDDFGETAFTDQNIPLVDKFYYRVFSDIGGRFLVSNEVALEFDFLIINVFLNHVVINKEGNDLYFNDAASNKFVKYDYEQEKEVAQGTLPSSFIRSLSFGSHNNEPEIYVSQNSSFGRIYDGNNLQVKTDWSSNGIIWDVVYSAGLLYVATDDFQNPLQVFNRNTLNVLASESFPTNFNERRMAVVGDGGQIVDYDNERLTLFGFNNQGQLEVQASVFTNFFGLLPEIVVSPDGQHFIPHGGGVIYDLDLNVASAIPSFGSFFDFAFSENKDRLFAIEVFGFNQFMVSTYSFPDLILQNSRTFGFSPSRIFVDGNTLLVLGLVNSNFSTATILEKIAI